MEGTRSPGHGSAIDRSAAGAGPARSPELAPGKRTLTMALDAATGAVPDAAAGSGLAAIAQMGPGRPLDGAAARAAAKVLGQAPGDVQIHTGTEAEQFVAQHGARAVTIANHIAFGAGQYQPGTPEGDRLIAHELAHVIQMRGADPAGPMTEGSAGAEAEADTAAEGIVVEQGAADDVPGRARAPQG
jgi:hypothetical protein